MKFLESLGRALIKANKGAPRRAVPSRIPAAGGRRSFDAGLVDRLTADWSGSNKTADAILRQQLRRIRGRSRDLCRNNDYAKRFLQLLAQNVIGPHAGGIRYQARTLKDGGKLDADNNRVLEEAFADWGKLGVCTLDGRMTWRDAQTLMIKTIPQDGEMLIRKIRGRQARNDFNFAIQLIEADHLDEDYCRDLGDGRKIEMSVEFDRYNRPVAYHVLTRHPGEDVYYWGGRKYMRVPAEEILHPFVFDRITQARGVPWFYSAMQRLQMLGGYEEAELIAARVAASQMGVITTETGDEEAGDGVDAAGNLTFEAEPGMFRQLASGQKLEMFDPKHPVDAFAPFCKAMLRGVAAGLGVSYTSLAQDLEGVNYSSLRHGALDERDAYRAIQTWFIGAVIDPIFLEWLRMGLTSGAIGGLPYRKLDEFRRREWQPRGWQWVDPLKEVNANIAAINAGLRSRGEVVGDQGRDLGDTFEALRDEQDLAAEYNLSFSETKGLDDADAKTDDDD